jgi:hypothetical protein
MLHGPNGPNEKKMSDQKPQHADEIEYQWSA